MKREGAVRRLLGGLCLALVAVCTRGAPDAQNQLFVGATVIDMARTAPMIDASILVEGATIRSVSSGNTAGPSGVQVTSIKDKFVIPGLADMHNHLFEGRLGLWPPDLQGSAQRLLSWGITFLFDTNVDERSFTELKRLTSPDEAPYPYFFGVGPLVTAKNGWGAMLGGYIVESAESAAQAVEQLKRNSVDAVKFVYDDMSWLTTRSFPILQPEAARAIVDHAHRRGLKVYVHAPILRLAKEALTFGVDGLVHGVISDPIDDEFVTLMKKNGATYVATLSMYEACADLSEWVTRLRELDIEDRIDRSVWESFESPELRAQFTGWWDKAEELKEKLPVARENLRKVSAAGIPVALGTDTGVPGVLLGLSTHMELQLHVKAGISPLEVLRAATLNAARMLDQHTRMGSLEPGKLANFVVLNADPTADITNTLKIDRVVKGGRVYDPRSLSPGS